MRFNAAPSSVLYAKVSLKRTPYANTIVAIRVVADTFSQFTTNKAQFVVDLDADTTSVAKLELVLTNLQASANAAELRVVKMQPAVIKRLIS